MSFSKTIHSNFSGHTLHISKVTPESVPDFIDRETYKEFYVVRNWDAEGWTFMYLGKGDKRAPKEIVVWYRNGAFWNSYGKNLKEAIEGAQRDGWKYV